VVIVNYRQWQETARLTRQILRSSGAEQGIIEVVVVDNHSPPHRLLSRLRRWDGVSVRRWKRNRGFAQAVNEGCRLSRGGWFLVLNPDVTLAPGLLDGVLAFVERLKIRESRTGIVGFQLRNADGSLQLSSGHFPTLGSTLRRLLLPRPRRKYDSPPTHIPSRVSWVTGCCLLLRRACLEETAGFDEDFFLYYEDVDFCRRAHDHGWLVRYEPSWHATHHSPLHSRPVSFPMRLVTRHALLTYSAKHWPRWQFRLLSGIVRVESWLRRQWALLCGDVAKANRWSELAKVASDVTAGRSAKALRRVRQAMQLQKRLDAGMPTAAMV
jgi:GT2 family glycosyltransferase